jgi:hypothetical protein
MSMSRVRSRLAALAVAGPLIAAGAPALTAQADAPSVGKATMVLTLGKYRVGPRAGFRGDVDRGVNGSTGIVKIAVASGTVLNSVVVKVNEGGGFPIYRDFNASDGFALYRDLNGNGRLDPADYEAGPVSQPGYGVSGDGTNAVVTVNGDPAKATGSTDYLLTVHPAEGSFSDRPVTFTVDANAVATSAGALPASPVVVDNAVIDSQAPVAVPATQFAPQSRIPTAVCPSPAPSLGCGNDGYKVYLGGVPTEDGEKLAFFNSASDLSDAALLVVPDGPTTSHAAIYDAAGLPDAQVQAAELSIGNGTGRDASVAGSRALNNQTSDTVYAVQWDRMGNTTLVTLTSDQCVTGAPGCPGPTPKLGNDVTGPKPTSYTISLGNITAATGDVAVTARGSISGVDTAVPANTPQAPVKQLARLQRVKQTSASPPAYTVEKDGEEKYSAGDATPAAGTITIDTVLNASDDTDFPESELVRAVGRLVDATGNVAMSATSNPPALKDTVSPAFESVSLIDENANTVSDPGEEFRLIFTDPIDPAKVGALDTDLKVTKNGGTCSPPTTTTDCVTWGAGATRVWSSGNRILTITLGQRSCNVSGTGPSCPGGFANRLPTAGDTVTASATVTDPVGNGITNLNRAIGIGAPFVLPYTASTIDTLLPSNVNVFGTNRDGILDAIDVKFTGALKPSTVGPASSGGKFKVGVPGDDNVAATAAIVGGSGDTVLRLTFTRTAGRDALWNTGAKPVVKLLAGSGLESSTSQVIAAFELTSDDKVGPVPVSLKTQDSSPTAPDSHLDHVIVQYSEPIKQGAENPCGYRVAGYTNPAYAPPNAAPTSPGGSTPSPCPTTPAGVGRNKPSPVPAGAAVSDTVSLELKPVAAFDTDVTPLVEFNATNKVPAYTGPGSGPHNTNAPACATNADLVNASDPNCPVVDADGNALPFFTGIALDAVGPTIVTRETADTNGDGKIDEIRVGFGEAFSTPSIGAALFTISDPTYTISSVSATSDRVLAVRVVPTDSRKGDSGITPKLAFLGGTTDTVEPPNASPTDAGVVVTDKAGPAIVGACVAMPTGTTAAKLGTCPTGTGNKMAVLMSETLDTAAANVAAADFVVEQPLGTVKTATAVSVANGTDGKGVVTLTFADNSLDYLANAFVRFSGAGVVTDNAAAKTANTQTANVIAFGAPTVSLDLTCPVAANPGYCSSTSINTGATGTPGVTAWRLADTGSSTVPPAAPTATDFTTTRPSTFPPPGVVLTEGTHNLWLTGRDDFDRVTDDATDSIVILKPPKIENVQWLNATPAKTPQAWTKTDTVLDGDAISIGADMYGTDAADWASAPVGGGCKPANLSADLRSLTGNSTKGAVAPSKCDLKTNTAPPFRQAQWTGITAQGTTKYPVGTALKISANDPGSLVVDGPSGTQLRRPFISVNARRSWQITDASVIQVPTAVVNGIPKGSALAYRDGSIVKGTSSGYYYVSANVKRPVSTATLAYLKIPTTTAYAVTPAELAAMPTLGGIGGGSFHPVGVWIKFSNGSVQQVVRNGSGSVVRRAVANSAALKTLVPASQIFAANAKDSTLPLDSFQRGYRDGTLLRLAGGTYGVVARSSLRRFANPATFNSLGYATGNAISANGGAMPHVAAQPYRTGTDLDRYKITTIVVKVTNGAGASATSVVKPSVGGIYGVGTLDPVPVGWDTSWM